MKKAASHSFSFSIFFVQFLPNFFFGGGGDGGTINALYDLIKIYLVKLRNLFQFKGPVIYSIP